MAIPRAKARWATRGTAPFSIAFVGDSVTEGVGATTPLLTTNARYVDVCRIALQARNLGGIVGGQGAFGQFFAAGAPTTPWTYGGTALSASDQARFMPARSVNLAGGGTPSTATIVMGPMTSLDVYYWQGSGATLPFTVTINGTVNTVTPSTTGGLNNNGHSNVAGGCTAAGNNTIVYAGNAGGISYPSGQRHYNGDESAGSWVLEGGHFGWTTANYLAGITGGNNDANHLLNMMPLMNVDLYVICLGLNDYQLQVPTATFASNVTSIIAQCKTWQGGYTASFLLVSMYLRTDVVAPTIPMTAYAAALSGVQAADTANCSFIDMAPVFAAGGAGLIGGDGVHPTDAGHLLFGTTVANAIVAAVSPSSNANTGAWLPPERGRVWSSSV